jgi:putative flippase GtrA
MNGGAEPLPVINFFVNGVFGLLIEFFTTVVFKQRPASGPARPAKAIGGVATA